MLPYLRMKTTVDIGDALFHAAKRRAARDRVTLRTLVNAALREYLKTDKPSATRKFQLRDASVDGQGLAPEFADQDWAALRSAVYEGRGG